MTLSTETRDTSPPINPLRKARTCAFNGLLKPRPMWGLGIASVILVLDQLSKWVALKYLIMPPHAYPITSFFNIILAWNKGISFGLLSSAAPYAKWALACIAIGFAALLIVWLFKAETKAEVTAFGMILGGAVGNVLDRVRFGAVIDFLDFHIYGYHWYTFNIADCAIVMGVGLIAFECCRGYCKESYQQKESVKVKSK